MHCLLERESRNHFCAAENCGVNNDSRNLPHFFRERVLDLHNTGQSECAIAQELGTGVKEIQNANEMSRNTVLSKLSHTVIERLAHFLFVLSLKYFSGDARKNAFFTASEKFRSNYKSYLSINIRDKFIRFKFLFTQRGKLGLLRVYLIKTAPPVLPSR